ncbi:MAG: hypothetical protein MK171_00705 [Pirellulales bacterium]|nr:hypothetical protein [Pirellulales bacterium]
MLTRLTHAAIAFAVTAVTYQAYVLLAVPLLEPPPVTRVQAQLPTDLPDGRATPIPHKYREVLSAYFPPGHWTLANPPKTFEVGKAMIVLDDYRPSDDGLVRVNKCALIFFPHHRLRGEPAPRNAVVLEASHGAELQMDESFRPGFGGFGRFQFGRLLGQITVRSQMQEPGPEDDLLLTTRDVYMTEDLIRTNSNVHMRVGPHEGRGRVMEIRLIAVEQGNSAGDRLNLGGIDSIEILYDVQAQLTSDSTRLVGGGVSNEAVRVHVTSKGRFRFQVADNKASFQTNVQVSQVHAGGVQDQLHCNELTLFLARAPENMAVSPIKLQPGSIMALGTASEPAVLDAPSQQATARGERMWLEAGSGRITIDGNDEVVLTHQGSEIHAPMVSYQPPPPDSRRRVGTLRAAGSGWISIRSGDSPSAQPLKLRWIKELRLERRDGHPILALLGRPRLEMIGVGRFWADRLELGLRERVPDGSEDDLLPSDIVVDRVVATGDIAMESAQLRGQIANQLEVLVEYAPNNLILASPHGEGAGPRQRRGGRPTAERGKSYQIDGHRLQAVVTVRNRRPEVTSIAVDGRVKFRETLSAQDESERPWEVLANSLRVKNADTLASQFEVEGNPATVRVGGRLLQAERMQFNRGTSRAWIQGSGVMDLPVDRDLSGRPLTAPQMTTIRWQREMEFDKDQLTFSGGVEVESAEGLLQTEQLTARFSAPVGFDGAVTPRPVELTQLECSGGTFARFSQRDAGGLTSMQMGHLSESLVVNQQTGKIAGVGRGWMESVHLSSGAAGLLGEAARPAERGQQLRFLRVDFMRGVEGNLKRRQMAVVGEVEAVYGPVDSWEQKLKQTLRGPPEPDTTWINAERLSVAESPLVRMQSTTGIGPLELSAAENVTIEGRMGERGRFATHSARASYDQLKTQLVLQGDGRQPATITLQEYAGAPVHEQVAKTIMYNHRTEAMQVVGFVGGGWKQFDIGQKARGEQSR